METIGEAFSEMNGPMTTIGVSYALFHKIPRIGGRDLNPSEIVPSVTRMATKIHGAIVIAMRFQIRDTLVSILFFKTRNSAAKKWS